MKKLLPTAVKILLSLLVIIGLTIGQQWIVDQFEESGNVFAAIIINFSFPVLIFFLVRVFNKKYNQLVPAGAGFTLKGFPKNLVLGIFSAVAIIGSVLGISTLFGVSFAFNGLQKNATVPLIELIAANWVIGAWEEMYFRGIVFNTLLKGKSGFRTAIFISAVLFTILHAGTYDMSVTSPFWFIVVFLLSYILVYLYVITRSIWAPVGFHFSWDLLWGMMDDPENKVDMLHLNHYADNAVLLDSISMPVLAVFLLWLFYIDKKRQASRMMTCLFIENS